VTSEVNISALQARRPGLRWAIMLDALLLATSLVLLCALCARPSLLRLFDDQPAAAPVSRSVQRDSRPLRRTPRHVSHARAAR
jgi:hypothetical protein